MWVIAKIDKKKKILFYQDLKDKFGEEFTFTNPLETARCGCGESFYIGLNND